jgi:hypothetical protein
MENKLSNMCILLFHDSQSSHSCVKVCKSETKNYIQLYTCFIHLKFYVCVSNVFIICYTVCFIRLVHCISSYFQGSVLSFFPPVLYTNNRKPH